MRNILNFIVTIIVFWIGSHYFSPYLSISDTQTLVLASIFMFVISLIYSFVLAMSVLSIVIGIGCLTTPFLILASLVLTPIKLWLLDKFLPGFEIHGFWTYVVLTIALSIFTVKTKGSSRE
ncbi:phage holin family protein [Paenibacillus aestuarii]|uniref:Phage holin family protein n=1 Tax=Paenibacillus aestuarii TaxID=516965 RepID=A0ABW0KBF5_9BACL|nr:phage holin family protein [Paenibacillus aestuarii]